MKHFSLFFVFLLIITGCTTEEFQVLDSQAEPINKSFFVSEAEAIKETIALLNDLDNKGANTRSAKDFRARTIKDIKLVHLNSGLTRTNGNFLMNNVYVVNFSNDQGYALLSSDKRTTPVFCITDKGTFDLDKMRNTSGLDIFLLGLEEYLDSIYSSIGEQTTYCSTRALAEEEPWTETHHIAPKVLTKWNQYSPFNTDCPKIQIGTSLVTCVAGCAPIAIGQMFTFYSLPENLNGHNYSWELIKQSESSSGTICSDIPLLIHDIGIGCNTNYTKEKQSSGIEKTVAHTDYNDMKHFLENLRCFKVVSDEKAKPESFIDCINKPSGLVIGSGFSERKKRFWILKDTYSGGHCWLMDGYIRRIRNKIEYTNNTPHTTVEVQELAHCNWGFPGGENNGYFILGAFNTTYRDNNIIPDPNTGFESGKDYKYKLSYIYVTLP